MPHINEKIDFCVETFIVYNGKVLLRKHDKLGIWLSVGGHIEPDEDPEQAALREIREEVGLEVGLIGSSDRPALESEDEKPLLAPIYMVRHPISNEHEHVVLVYFAQAKNDKIKLSKSEVSEAVRWFSPEELNNPEFGIRPKIRFYASKALEKFKT